MYVAIDTSTDTVSVALARDGVVLGEDTWHCVQNHTRELLPHLVALMEQTKVSLDQASAIMVAKGPGSFNGVRVGMSTAKGLAFSLGRPIIGVSSLEILAHAYADTGLPVCAVVGAGSDKIAAAIYQKKQSKWQQLLAEQVTTIEALSTRITGKTVFCGEYISNIAGELKTRLGEKAVIMPEAVPARAVLLAQLGHERLNNVDVDDIATLQPLYLRHPVITTRKHL